MPSTGERMDIFRISLTYDAPAGENAVTGDAPTGRAATSRVRRQDQRHTDTYRRRFAKLVPNERVVEVVEFETEDPALVVR
jgi:hypothetical protein